MGLEGLVADKEMPEEDAACLTPAPAPPWPADDFRSHLHQVLASPGLAELHYQPIVDLREGSVTGYEALARFPRQAGMTPDQWFDQAKKLGKREELLSLMARKALDARPLMPINCFLSLNIAPDFLVSPSWQEILEGHKDIAGVIVEITEEESIGDYERLRAALADIRERGGLVAVDDAGAGYASLHHILEVRPDFIKIDRHFVQNCSIDRARSTMIEMVGAAASRLDAWIVAEGVELVSELEELMRLDVPLAQGYLLGRPANGFSKLEPWISEIIRRRTPKSDGPTLAEHTCACEEFSTTEGGVAALTADPHLHEAVVVDRWERPIRLVHRHPLTGIRELSRFMRAQIESHPAEVLERALAREDALRFDPIVVVGTAGECLGIVCVDRLMRAMLGTQRRQATRS